MQLAQLIDGAEDESLFGRNGEGVRRVGVTTVCLAASVGLGLATAGLATPGLLALAGPGWLGLAGWACWAACLPRLGPAACPGP